MSLDVAELARLETLIAGQHERIIELEARCNLHEQAILELDAALRRSGVLGDGDWALSLAPPAGSGTPGRPSADQAPTIPA